ncbi:ArsR family transcriptional regulator [bacterium]|nr:MAG: ArsR family transcriptional regulator [bacterium]
MGTWTFLSNHTHVLVCLMRDPEMRLREVSEQVGITERAVQRIVGELVDSGALTKEKTGRRNSYRVHPDVPFRHPLESHCAVGDILKIVV